MVVSWDAVVDFTQAVLALQRRTMVGGCAPSFWGKELKLVGWGVLKLNTWL